MEKMPGDYSPTRIVSLQPSATVILDRIGEIDRLIACTKYCVDVCPEIGHRGVTVVNDSWTANSGQITSLNPDLVIASVPYQEKAVIEILKSGATFLGFSPRTLTDVYRDIASISGIVGASERGDEVIADMQHKIESIRRKTQHLSRPRVFCEEWGKPIIASQSWVAELVEAAGGEFLGEPGRQTTAEDVLSKNPDVLVAAWCGAGDRVPLEKIVRERGWSETRAAMNGSVYCIRDEFLNTPAPTLVEGLKALASAIHPQDFPQAPGLRCIRNVPAASL